MTNYIKNHIQVIFGCAYSDFAGLLLVFVEIMQDEVILDHKRSYLVYFEIFFFFVFFLLMARRFTQKIFVFGF